jgi:glycosyltransferase involved in cell wall biosynthesis
LTAWSSSLRIALVGPATPALLQHHFDYPIKSMGYPYPGLPSLAEGLRRLGHHVSIITTAIDITEPLSHHADAIDLYLVPSRLRARSRALDFFAAERKHLVEAITKSRPDIVHAHWTYEFALAAIDSKVAPVLVTARDAPLEILRHTRDPYRLIRTLMAYQVRLKTQNLTAVSPYLAHRWKWQMGYLRPISVIPNSLPTLAVGTSPRSSTPVVLGVGNDSRGKNFRALLSAFPLVLAEHENAQLRLVGPGLEPDGFMADWARSHALARSVTFVGPVDRSALAREMSEATVFCHPSLEESFGNVLIEALLAGLPVVAGRKSGGVPWVLFDGQAGLLVDVRNSRKIAEGISTAIQHPASTVSDSLDLATELQRRFSAEAVARQYVDVYTRLLRSAGKGERA